MPSIIPLPLPPGTFKSKCPSRPVSRSHIHFEKGNRVHDSYLLLFICFDAFITFLEQTGGTFESILFFLGKRCDTKLDDVTAVLE